jgi:hypothetical protein
MMPCMQTNRLSTLSSLSAISYFFYFFTVSALIFFAANLIQFTASRSYADLANV